MTLYVKILQFLKTFTLVTARLNFFLIWLFMDLHIKEGLVECAKVCNKSVVILLRFQGGSFYGPMVRYKDLLASLRKCIEGPTQLIRAAGMYFNKVRTYPLEMQPPPLTPLLPTNLPPRNGPHHVFRFQGRHSLSIFP